MSYNIKSGDTLWSIVKNQFKLTNNTEIANKVNEVAKANNITNPNSIFAGKTLELADTTPAPTSAQVTSESPASKTSTSEVQEAKTETPKDINTWANTEVASSMGLDANDNPIFTKEPNPFELTDEKGKKALVDMNTLMDEHSTDQEAMERVNSEVKSTYIADLKKKAQFDIAKNYNKDGDGIMSEDEYVNNELETAKTMISEDDPNPSETLNSMRTSAKMNFIRMNIDTEDGKNGVTVDEYATHLLAMDANNKSGKLDGEITGEEYQNSDYTFASTPEEMNSERNFLIRKNAFYGLVQSVKVDNEE